MWPPPSSFKRRMIMDYELIIVTESGCRDAVPFSCRIEDAGSSELLLLRVLSPVDIKRRDLMEEILAEIKIEENVKFQMDRLEVPYILFTGTEIDDGVALQDMMSALPDGMLTECRTRLVIQKDAREEYGFAYRVLSWAMDGSGPLPYTQDELFRMICQLERFRPTAGSKMNDTLYIALHLSRKAFMIQRNKESEM